MPPLGIPSHRLVPSIVYPYGMQTGIEGRPKSFWHRTGCPWPPLFDHARLLANQLGPLLGLESLGSARGGARRGWVLGG